MEVEALQLIEAAWEGDDPDAIEIKERGRAADPGRFKSWAPRHTDKGHIVSLFTIEMLRPGQIYDLPADQAETLIAIGYVKAR